MIRTAAFASQAGLPILRGCKPFGGHILSHDFVEAALMRRGGWAIHMIPALIVFLRRGPPFRARLNARDWVFRSRRGDEKCPPARLWAQVWRDGVSTGHGRRL
jgi:membrane glycosyltransferase